MRNRRVIAPRTSTVRFACALVLACGLALPALASTAAPTLNTGGSGAPGSVSSARGTTNTRTGTGGCTGCDDHDACTDDTCDAEYNCVHTPIVCDDGLRCTTDACSPATGCVYTPMDCSAGNVCITSACSEATGTCILVGKRLCSDRNACTQDACDPELGCLHIPVLCNDYDACTQDSCDPSVGCIHRSGACGHGPGDSAPSGAGTGAPSLTASSGDVSSEPEAPLPGEREGSGSRVPVSGIDGSPSAFADRDTGSGLEEICALAAGNGADDLARLLRAGWPASVVDPELSAAWALREMEAARAAGICGEASVVLAPRRSRVGVAGRVATARSSP